MQNRYLKLASILIFFIGTIKIYSQPQVNSYSDLNDVYSLYFDDTSGTTDTMWIGTSGGIVYRVSNDFSVTYTLTKQDNGLGSNFITAIVADDNGNKFFGSFDNGVTMYNESSITIFNSGNSPINNRIFCLAKDNNGNIWAGTSTGAYRFNGTNWDSFNTSSEAPGEIRSIATDGNLVWFGAFGGGLHSYDIVNLNWTHQTASDGNIASDQITALAARNDSLFVGTNQGVSFRNESGTWMPTLTIPGNPNIHRIKFGSNVRYVSTSMGLYTSFSSTLNPVSFPDLLPNNPCGAIELQGQYIWIGYNEQGGGAFQFDPIITSGHPPAFIITDSQYPLKNSVSAILSNKNEVYVASYGWGLAVFDGAVWNYFDSDIPTLLFNDLTMQADTLWLASDDGAVRFFEGSIDFPLLQSIKISAIAADKSDNNRIWCATSNGVTTLYNQTIENSYTTANGLFNNEILAITVDVNNNVWFMHINGLTRYDETNTGNEFTTFTLSDLGLSGAQLSDIAADQNGNVWITSDHGVVEFDGNTAVVYTTTDGLTDNLVTSVYINNKNVKYFGTNSNGISILSDYGWKKISKMDGILTDHITAITFQESESRIWSAGDWGGISATGIYDVSIEASVSPDIICYGNYINLDAQAFNGFGPGSYNFTWSEPDGTVISNSPNVTVQPRLSTTYYSVEVNDGNTGTYQEFPVTVNVVDTSKIVGFVKACPDGNTVTYSLESGTAGVNNSYYWDINGGSIVSSDVTASSIDVIWYTDRPGGSLYLTESDANCTITQQLDIEILINAKPDIVLKNGGRILICKNPGLKYQWYRNEVAIPGADRQFYYLDENSGSIAGAYFVEVDTINNCKIASDAIDVLSPGLKTYPVPTKSTINIDFSSKINESGNIVIRNLQGIIIEQIPFTKEREFKHLEIDVSNYQPGTYFYSLFLGAEKTESGKIIIN